MLSTPLKIVNSLGPWEPREPPSENGDGGSGSHCQAWRLSERRVACDGAIEQTNEAPPIGNPQPIQADRRIVVAGFAIINRRDRFAVARYRSTGSLDGTFGESGRRITRIGSSAFAHDVALQPDGKIVAVGDALIGGRDRFAVARYNSNGSRDATFSADGVVTTLIGSRAIAYGLALQSDGNVLAAAVLP